MKNKKPKSKINKWKLTAIISLVVNGIVALLLTIGLATPKSYVKASADFEYSYDASKIITDNSKINSNIDYKLYFDWNSNAVDPSNLDTSSFYFAYFDSFTAQSCSTYYYLPHVIGSFSINRFDARVLSTGATLSFNINGQNYPIYTIYSDTSLLVPFDNDINVIPMSTQYEIRALMRSFFSSDYSVSIFDKHIYSDLFSTDFLVAYFSNYSVQSLQLVYSQGGYDRVRSFDFQSSFQFYNQTLTQNYSLIYNNLIVSPSPLFANLVDNDNGIMLAGLGDFIVNGNHFNGLAYYWTRFNFDLYDNIMLDNFLISSTTTNKYYYYLDCLVPINFSIGHLTWNNINAVAYFHTNVVNQIDDAYGHTERQLRMTSDVLLTSNQLTIKKLATNSIVDSGVTIYTPSISFSALSYLFKVVNHFYYNSGSPIITDPLTNEIDNSTNNITGVFALISGAFESLIPLLSIMVLPNISIGVLLFIPLVLTIIIVVIKLVKR